MLRFLTAGESHGPALTLILEGLPAGVPLSLAEINQELHRRQQGYGRGGRMRIEQDQVQVSAGLRKGKTLGSPLALRIENRDWPAWQEIMHPEKAGADLEAGRLLRPRPGHADLAGALKYDRQDFRDILERASARETASRVAAGAVAKCLLAQLEIFLGSWVEQIGAVHTPRLWEKPDVLARRAEKSDVRCPNAAKAAAMRRAIDRAKAEGDSLGGVFAVSAWGVPPGLGSHVHWDRRLDARIAGAIMSIPAIKGVEFGLGFEAAGALGSKVHDPIHYRAKRPHGGFFRETNHAGGLEGGMSNGEPILVRAAMKPIPTLRKPLASIDIRTKKTVLAGVERSDVCAVPAAGVVAEAMLALVLVQAVQEKFGGDSLSELKRHWKSYLAYLERR